MTDAVRAALARMEALAETCNESFQYNMLNCEPITAAQYKEAANAYAACADILRAALANDSWRDMESAPRDGTSILVTDGQCVDQAEWNDDAEEWIAWGGKRKHMCGEGLGYTPTNWRPKPTPPKEPAS